MSFGQKYRKFLVKALLSSLKRESPPMMFINPYDLMGRQVLQEGVHESGYLKELIKYLRENVSQADALAFVDVGANIGNHSIFLSHYFANGFAFEPMPLAYKACEANFLLNSVTTVKLFNLGLASRSGDLDFWSPIANLGGSGIYRPEDFEVHPERYRESKCRVVVADEFPELELRRNRVGLVKIDVEGFEDDVLKGMTNLLQTDRPVVVFESHGKNGEACISTLSSLGYDQFWEVKRQQFFGVYEYYSTKPLLKLQSDHLYPMIIANSGV